MTPQARAGVVRDHELFGVHGCRQVAPMTRQLLDDDELREARHLRLEGVKVTGDRAVGRLAGLRALKRISDTRLRRIGGHWLIDDDHPRRGWVGRNLAAARRRWPDNMGAAVVRQRGTALRRRRGLCGRPIMR